MTNLETPGDAEDLTRAIDNVCMCTYVALILAQGELRTVVDKALLYIKENGESPAVRDKAVDDVAKALGDWGFPQDFIDRRFRHIQLLVEPGLFATMSKPLPSNYTLTGCTAPTIRPALGLLSKGRK